MKKIVLVLTITIITSINVLYLTNSKVENATLGSFFKVALADQESGEGCYKTITRYENETDGCENYSASFYTCTEGNLLGCTTGYNELWWNSCTGDNTQKMDLIFPTCY